MNLVRDVLDQQIIDCKQQKTGKVDGIALEIRDDDAPRVAYLDIGTDVRLRRISRRVEPLWQRIRRRVIGHDLQPYRLPWHTVEAIEVSVNLNAEATDYSGFELENWLRDRIVTKIPGNAHHKHQEKSE